jgi:hypothetical protein
VEATAAGGPPDDTPVTVMGSATAASAARIFERRRMWFSLTLMGRPVTQTGNLITLGRGNVDVNG